VQALVSKSSSEAEMKQKISREKLSELLQLCGMTDPPRKKHVHDFFRVSKNQTLDEFVNEYLRMISLKSILAMHHDISSKQKVDQKTVLSYFTSNSCNIDAKYLIDKLYSYLKKKDTATITLSETLKWYQNQFHMIGENRESKRGSQAASETKEKKIDEVYNEKKDELPSIIRRNSKIVATLGPASSSLDMLRKLVRVGVNIFRLNFSHAKPDYSNMVPLIEALQQIKRENAGTPYVPAVLADLQGPKFRTGELKDHKEVTLVKGSTINLVTSKIQTVGDGKTITTGTADADLCVRNLEVGQRVMINDGAIVLRVKERKSKEELKCEVLIGGVLSERKGINTPELTVPLPALTAKDKKDCKFVCEGGFADFIALSFVQRKEDVEELKQLISISLPEDAEQPKIICKIEKPQAIECIDSILEVTDGIMVARGDLGVECSLQKLPGYQKLLIHKANLSKKIVITATQMLESMITNAAPTRAEVSDVANACYDGTDAVMLSGESAVGNFPIEAVTMMSEICLEAEKTMRELERDRLDYEEEEDIGGLKFRYAVAESACRAAEIIQAKAVIFFCEQFEVAIYLAKLRPSCPIFIVTFTESIASCTQGLYGCHPILIKEDIESFKTTDDFTRTIERHIFSLTGTALEESDVMVCAHRCQFPSLHNTVRMVKLGKSRG